MACSQEVELQFRQANQGQQPGRVVAVFVGEPGHGKSQLGNFLADVETSLECYDAPTGRRLPFMVTISSDACAERITSAEFDFNNKQFSVVDIPNYSQKRHLPSDLQVAQYLKKTQQVSAIVFCIRCVCCSKGPTSCKSSWHCFSLA